MELKDLLRNIDFSIINGNTNININKLVYDNRKAEAGDVFFCIKGFRTDGHSFAANAVANGAKVVICEREVEGLDSCTVIKVKDSRKALAIASSNYYGEAWKKLKLIGITGTNGKTTSTFMMKSILESAGCKVGVIGTIANYIGSERIPTERTTPESLELHKLFKEMVEKGVSHCVMEVSSHSLALDRVYGIEFSEGIFTNLTQDHLDFHITFENYYNAKLILFKNSINSIVNTDDEYGRRVLRDISKEVLTYGLDTTCNLSAQNIIMHANGIEFDLNYKGQSVPVRLNLPGKYNIYNALGSAAACLKEGVSLLNVKEGLEKVFVPGRCELVTRGYNLGFEVIVDYAHSPDGLENILKTAREFTKGRLIVVFGCGGDRDKTKRPIMGKIGSELSDIAFITSDNPRSEEPMEIIKDIIAGISQNNYEIVENRKDAIEKAIKIARPMDVIVVAGKGHEDYQELKSGKIHFDEREVIGEVIKELL